jgi:hypothetical protein
MLSRYKLVLSVIIVLFTSIFFSGCTNPLAPKKAGLQVITNEVPSSIFINGQYLEKTPYIGKDLKPGEYTLKIQPDDTKLVAHETTVQLRSGLLTVVTWKPGDRPETSGGVIYEMEKMSNSKNAELSIISIPDGAIVKVDDNSKEFTPVIIRDVTAGQHEFEVSLPSYDIQKHTINVVAGYRMNVTVKLARASEALEQTLSQTNEASSSAQVTASPLPTGAVASNSSQIKTATNSAKTTPKLITGPSVKILPTNMMVNGKEVLRVRDAASNGKEIGFAPVGSNYSYLNEKSNGWLKIDFEGQTGWVSGQYAELKEN